MTVTKENTQRRYMEFITEAINKKEFSVTELRRKYCISQPYASLANLNWAKSGGPGTMTKWIGPKPKTNEELYRMAKILHDDVIAYNKAKNAKYFDRIKKESVPAKPKKPSVKERRAMVPAKPRLQVLWGLITIW